jgi:serine/threonine protein kinase
MNIPRIPLLSPQYTSFSPNYMSISSSPANMDISDPILSTTRPLNTINTNPTLSGTAYNNLYGSLSTTMPATIPVTNPTTQIMSMSSLSPNRKVGLELTANLQGVNKYKEIEKIGSGGQGAVYKVQNLVNSRIVALKVVNITSRNASDAVKELASLERISKPTCHPFLACYYDHYFDSINKKLFIEMEYIEGQALNAWSKKFTGPTLYNNLLLVLDDLCKALSFIHSQGIIHRDIKPENIIVTNDNIPKLIDFGVSCFTILCYENLACCKQDPGTLPYMAPETYYLRESYYATDLWSLGVTFFVLATGLYPFNFSNAKTLEEYRAVVLNNRPLALTSPNEKLNLIVNSCLIRDPRTRITIPQIQDIIRA